MGSASSYAGTDGEGCQAMQVSSSVQASEVCRRPQLFQRVPCTVPRCGGLHKRANISANNAIELSQFVVGALHKAVLANYLLRYNLCCVHCRKKVDLWYKYAEQVVT